MTKLAVVALSMRAYFKPTKHGEEMFRAFYQDLDLDPEPYIAICKDQGRDGMWGTELHELMHIFGPALFVGNKVSRLPLENQILIETLEVLEA